jgi:hypothetical protein
MSGPRLSVIKCAPTKIRDDGGKTYPCAYPAGLLESLRDYMVGGMPTDPVLHVCGGYSHHYNTDRNYGYGPNDRRLDLNPETGADFVCDCRDIGTSCGPHLVKTAGIDFIRYGDARECEPFRAVIFDPDYDQENADRHGEYNELLSLKEVKEVARRCFDLVVPGGLVAVMHFHSFNLGEEYHQVHLLPVVICNQQTRAVSVWQRKADRLGPYGRV